MARAPFSLPMAGTSRSWLSLPRLQRWRRRATPYSFFVPALLFLAIFLVYPMLTNVLYSVERVDVGGLLTGDTPFVGWQNYQHVLSDPTFRTSVLISAIFTIVCIAFQFTIGFALALLFKERFPLVGPMRGAIMIGWLLPVVVSGTIFKWMLQLNNGIFNYALLSFHLIHQPIAWLDDPKLALAGPILANIWIGIPFNMSLLLAGLQGIPASLYEAASVDGATAWQRFWWITLPMMRAPSSVVLVLGTIYTLNVFDLLYIMTGGGPVNATTTVPLYAYQSSFVFFDLGSGAAATMLLLAFLVVVAVIYLVLLNREEAR